MHVKFQPFILLFYPIDFLIETKSLNFKQGKNFRKI
jgi:hypothetical protein